MEFAGKVAIVTGGGRGMGRAVSLAFAREGAAVVVVDVDRTSGAEVAESIVSDGGRALYVYADVSQRSDTERVATEAIATFGGIDILHNNAGISRLGTVTEMSEEDWDLVIAVNLKGIYLMSRACIPGMIERGGGAIINTASTTGMACQPRIAAYAASKLGVVGLTRSMAVDYGPLNIRVNAICPASIDTPMLRRDAARLRPDDPDAIVRMWGRAHPLGRVGRPEEVADLVLFLASPRASFIAGGAYLIDGGRMSRLPE